MAQVQQKKEAQVKVLRIGIVQDGKIVQERVMKAGEAVTVGESVKNTFVFPPTALPKRYELFKPRKGGGYILYFTDKMQLKISFKDQILGAEQLRTRPDVVKKGDEYGLPIDESNRGKVTIDGVTVLFQFVPPAPELIGKAGTQDFRPRLFDPDDTVFFGFLGLFSVMALILGIYIANAPPVEPVSVADLGDDYKKLFIEEEPEPEELPEEVVDENAPPTNAPAEQAPAANTSNQNNTPQNAEQREAAAAQAVAQSNFMVGLLGTTGDADGERVESLFGQGDFAGQGLDEALKGVSGSEVATAGGLSARTGAGAGGGGDVGVGVGGATTGGTGVGSGPKTVVKGEVGTEEADDLLAEGDIGSVQKVVKKNSGQIRYCYDGELKNNPKLAGRVEIKVSMNAGKVTSTSVQSNTTGSDTLARCMQGKVKSWAFPPESTGDVILPFVLSPAS